jgi:APA family basic amino acid/polyamine antiporter
MPRRRIALRRGLGPVALASVAYGEVGSSLFFALGIVALYALGFTPWVLLVVGLLFLVVALSYAEGTAALPEAGGGAMFVRRAFNDPAGFIAGWALFLDYLIVIALAAFFTSNYLGHAAGWEALRRSPWDLVVGVAVIVAVATVWLGGRRRFIRRLARIAVALALATHVLIAVLGLAFLASADALGHGVDLGTAPTWREIAFALPVAMLAYTGLETVANLAAETRDPARTLPRGLLAGIGAVITFSFVIGIVGISAYPAEGRAGTELATEWQRAPLVGIVAAMEGDLPTGLVDVLRVAVGAAGVVVLVAAVATAIAGAGRLAYSLGQHAMLPHAFAVLSRRTLLPWPAIAAAAAVAVALLIAADRAGDADTILASLYSFGILLAFTAAQLAIVRLRFREPALGRPFRVPLNVRFGGAHVPLLALLGAVLTFALWIAALATHQAARIGGPLWLLLGIALFAAVRVRQRERILGAVAPPVADLVPETSGAYQRILVPLKLSEIGEEVLATAIKLAEEHRAAVRVLHVLRVPLELPIDAPLPEQEDNARVSLEEASELAAEHGVEIETEVVRARSIGEAVVEGARRCEADLILLGSAPRWRQQSRFFSPTVDYVLRHAPCEVMVVAYPQGILEEV